MRATFIEKLGGGYFYSTIVIVAITTATISIGKARPEKTDIVYYIIIGIDIWMVIDTNTFKLD